MSEIRCDICGGAVWKFGRVKRIVKGEGGEKCIIFVQRYRCKECKRVWRCLPEGITRFKQYRTDIIDGVRLGEIDESMLEYEDYPCEITMRRWRTQE